MIADTLRTSERAGLAGTGQGRDPVQWQCHWQLRKWHGRDARALADVEPDEVLAGEGNLLMTNGANALWTALTGGAITAYNNANSYIGVGDSSAAESASQTDLQATTNKLRKAMDATYPSVSTNQVTFRSTFGSADANFTWNEWAVFNAGSGGTMLNRKVQSLGTKASGSTWQLTVTLSLS
jgi:hypothetical protein